VWRFGRVATYEFWDKHGSVFVRSPMAEGPPARLLCEVCNNPLRRIYDVSFGNLRQLKAERDVGGARALAQKFLPSASDFASPGDPDGAKGLRTWADEHDPKPGNKTPMYPEGTPKRSW